MKLNLKFTASRVDEIEQASKQPIENCISNTSIASLTLFIQKGLVNDSDGIGVGKNKALSVIDEYLAENDKDELVMDIMEALINGGFLSRDLDMEKLRAYKKKRQTQVTEEIANSL